MVASKSTQTGVVGMITKCTRNTPYYTLNRQLVGCIYNTENTQEIISGTQKQDYTIFV